MPNNLTNNSSLQSNQTYTVKEVSAMLKVSIRKAYELCDDSLPCMVAAYYGLRLR